MPNYAMHANKFLSSKWLLHAMIMCRRKNLDDACVVHGLLLYVSGLCFGIMFLDYVSGICFWIMFLDYVSGLGVKIMFLDYVC